MLRSLRIGPRLIFLIAVQSIVLLAIGLTALLGLNFASQSTEQLNRSVNEGTRLSYLADTVRTDLITTINRVNAGSLDWDTGRSGLAVARRQFEEDWSTYTGELLPDEFEFVNDVLTPGLDSVRQAFVVLEQVFQANDRDRLAAFVQDDMSSLIAPFLNALLASSSERQLVSSRIFGESLRNNRFFLYSTLGVIVVGLLLAGFLGFLIYRAIVEPIAQISNTVQSVAEGSYDVRTGLVGHDELSELGNALDGLIEERVTNLVKVEEENERLNDSVLRLLDGVSRMSERDLTVTVPVTPDVTGPVADAINQMVEETAKVLLQVSRIANQVGAACATVNRKSMAVSDSATNQQQEVNRTAAELASASETLKSIAHLARECNQIADRTSKTTQKAMNTVTGTLSSMNEIREAIQETGKRIKRLGERSQEITSVVDIINTISERTHMLAVNASMQAAAAGEAGRGFAVVADEVQRLAESSREATAQIASLVKNIQVDTNDTIVTMDKTISQVVDGSHMAESAGEQMTANQETTERLVEAVQEIAKSSEEQARISNELRGRASGIVEGSRATAEELTEQLVQTRNLVKFAKVLLQSVRVFKLPQKEAA